MGWFSQFPSSKFLATRLCRTNSYTHFVHIAIKSFTLLPMMERETFSAFRLEAALKVFIVEDSDPVKRRLVSTLSDMEGIELIGNAETEWDAIQGILSAAPDVVILDIQLRQGNGMNVLTEVKRRLPDLKVIVLTNFGYPQYHQRCLQAGADHFLDKSSEFMSVEEIIFGWAGSAKTAA